LFVKNDVYAKTSPQSNTIEAEFVGFQQPIVKPVVLSGVLA